MSARTHRRPRRYSGLLVAAALSVSSSAFAFAPAIETPMEISQENQPIYALMAAEPATTPAAAPSTAPGVESLQVTITGVDGTVQVREAEDKPWKRAVKGMVVNENAEFRTSLRSSVQIQIEGEQIITLDRLGTIKVVQAVNDNGKFKTKVGMKYGRTRYDIESAGQEHEASISSPSSTLAIRGTRVSLTDQRPFVAEAVSLTGRAQFQDTKKKVGFGGKGAGKLKVDTNSSNSAQYALTQSVVDPTIALARTESEQGLVNQVISSGGSVQFDQKLGIPVVTGGRPLRDKELIPNLPGVLNFVLRWDKNTNLNLGIIEPGAGKGHTVYPISGYTVLSSGGKTAFDHRGGKNGGIEVVSYPAGFPTGTYTVGAAYIGGEITPARVDVFLNGERIDILAPSPTGPQKTKTANFTGRPVPPGTNAEGILVGRVTIPPVADAKAIKKAKR